MSINGIQVKNSYLSFLLHKEIFAVDVKNVIEVLEKQSITEVPDTPEYIVGVLNFRGEILPVFEIRTKFNMPEREKDTYVIIVLELFINEKRQLLGAIVDSVVDVLEISDAEIKEVPELGENNKNESIIGMYKSNDGFIMLLDIQSVFSKHVSEITSKL